MLVSTVPKKVACKKTFRESAVRYESPHYNRVILEKEKSRSRVMFLENMCLFPSGIGISFGESARTLISYVFFSLVATE